MSVTIFDDGFVRMTAQYVKALKAGVFYYYRRIPKDLKAHFNGRTFRKVSLGTRDLKVAINKAAPMVAGDTALWKSLRSPTSEEVELTTRETGDAAKALLDQLGIEPGSARKEHGVYGWSTMDILGDYLRDKYRDWSDPDRGEEGVDQQLTLAEREAIRLLKEDPRNRRVLLSDARDAYLANHPKGERPKFAQSINFAIDQVIDAVGDLPLQSYRRADANKVRDFLLARNTKTTTVRRRLNDIVSVVNAGLVEFDLQKVTGNPFEKLRIPNEALDATEREGFTEAELAIFGPACIKEDDDIRHIAALQADTGARLGEIVGLRMGDVILDDEVPHIDIRPFPELGRTLKNAQSQRKVPLLGLALWAARNALRAAQDDGRATGWLFPRYAADHNIKSTHASNTINKWIGTTLKIDKTTHSFRHAMQTRLKHAGVPKDIRDAIGGWGTRSIGEGYGERFLLRQLREQLAKVIFWKDVGSI
jgi:integrase